MNRFTELLPDFEPFGRNLTDSSIVARFSDIAQRFGNHCAVESSEATLSYAALDRASDAIASSLLDRMGMGPQPVALLYRHGPRYLEALLGVLKAGKFFASLDCDLSPDRLQSLVSDLGPRLILCAAEFREQADALAGGLSDCAVLCPELISATNVRPAPVEISPDDLAYVIYTSGSTGKPAGVMISHRVALHFTMNQTNSMHVNDRDRCLQICPLSSTASTGEILPILLNGGTLLPYRPKLAGPRRLARWVIERRVSMFTLVPVLFRLLLARIPDGFQFPDVRMVRLSGDRITRGDCLLFAHHFSPRCILRASLGAAEANLYTEYFVHRDSIPDGQFVPAGYALPDFEISVVDSELQPLQRGEAGEIAVASRYLSDGYWNNEALTAERFHDCVGERGTRLYLSRDLGYFDEEGCLVHLGRTDSRVKIYGRMVSISEIEESLLEMPDIREAAVVAVMEDAAETCLAAYYVPEPAAEIGDHDVRRWLSSRFPAEIVPKRIVRLDELPVTQRNKIDRAWLSRQYAAPERSAGERP